MKYIPINKSATYRTQDLSNSKMRFSL